MVKLVSLQSLHSVTLQFNLMKTYLANNLAVQSRIYVAVDLLGFSLNK